MCTNCDEYEQQIAVLEAAQAAPRSLTAEEIAALLAFLRARSEEHVQEAGEASWNDDD